MFRENEQEGMDGRSVVVDLPRVAPPQELTTRLRVIASRERARRLSRVSLRAALRSWRGSLRLFTDNLMRPMAIPFAGGLCSAVLLFGVLIPTLQFTQNLHNDVPSGLFTQASLDFLAPFDFTDNDVAIEFTIDEHGAVVDAVTDGRTGRKVRNDIGNMVLFTTFNPATAFGQPTSGKLRVLFRRSRINIRG